MIACKHAAINEKVKCFGVCWALGLSMTWPVFAGQVIHDGDTLRLDGVRVRLWGMDAPELGEMCLRGEHTYDAGAAARDALAGLVGGRAVECAHRWDTSAAITG
jgi:hypothetical protein